MNSKGATVLAFLALIVAAGALGYATWMNWELQESLSVSAESQDRNFKEMMISLAHTEGQLGRVKEAMKSFDLQHWLATVQGPLVDRLEEKMSAVQREVVREEVKKWAEQMATEQGQHWESLSRTLGEARADLDKQAETVRQLEGSLMALLRENEALSKKRYEEVQARFAQLVEQGTVVQDRLGRAESPAAQVQADLEGIRQESRRLVELIEQQRAAATDFHERVDEQLQLVADAAARHENVTRDQIEQATKHWQGLFLTLREHHEAELQGYRDVASRFEREQARVLEQAKELTVETPRENTRRIDRTRENVGGPMGELLEFCTRRPESVLCRDLEIR